jgi:heat shock protein HtpX
VVRSARFAAGSVPGPIRIHFGYRLDQLAIIYVPLLSLALVLTLIARGLCLAGLEHLQRSLFLVGTMIWLGAASRLQAADPIRILLSGTGLANIAASFLEYCPPLLCVAVGAALGSMARTNKRPGEAFSEIFWSYGIFLFPLTSALGAVPAMADGDLLVATPWLVMALVSLIVCRWRIRALVGSTVRQLAGGELKDRVKQLAVEAGHPDARLYVSSSTRSQVSNAFALPRNGIVLTAPLVRSLTRREVDAVAAHELSHLGHRGRSPFAALAVAAVLFQTPLIDILFPGAAGLIIAVLLPLGVFLMILRGARKREFAADAGAVALTGDARALISGLTRIARNNGRPVEFNTVVEWFSTHPSTHKRIAVLAGAGSIDWAEVATLSSCDAQGEPYTLPSEDSGALFNPQWQNTNAARYGWAILFGATGAGLLAAWLIEEYAGVGILQLTAGIVLGCALTKMLATAVMASNYARLRRRLERKLGASGQLVGLAIDSEPRVYDGYRFSDAGFLTFEGGMLHYRSERTTIILNPADVVEVGMIAAAPSSWRRLQPLVRFRHPESGDVKAFIVHPVEWGATPQRLFQAIEHWRATDTSAEATSTSGFEAVAGQPFQIPSIAQVARGFRIPGGVALAAAMLSVPMLRAELWPVWYALAVTACAYTYMLLPAMLYQRPSTVNLPMNSVSPSRKS